LSLKQFELVFVQASLRVIKQLEVKVILKELNIYSIDITKVLTLPIMNEKEEDK
jgi:hypothetical protein